MLCSPQIKYCSKCGEPLPSIKQRISKDNKNNIIKSILDYVDILKKLEKEIQHQIPFTEVLQPNHTGYIEENGNVTGLNLYKCKLTKIPDQIFKLLTLKMLLLRRNNLIELPKEIGFLTQLEILDLRINQLKNLPHAICLLQNLKYINISSNSLFSIPKSIGNLKSLELLNLSNNKLKSVPDSICNLKSLKELNIKANFWISPSQSLNTLEKRGVTIIK